MPGLLDQLYSYKIPGPLEVGRKLGFNLPSDKQIQGLLGFGAEALPGSGMVEGGKMGRESGRAFDARNYLDAAGLGAGAMAMYGSELLGPVLGATTRKGLHAVKGLLGRGKNALPNNTSAPIGHNRGPTIYSPAGAGVDKKGKLLPGVKKELETRRVLESNVSPIGKRGQKLGVPSPYSRNLKVDEDYLQSLDSGLITRPNPNLAPKKFITPEDLEGTTVFPITGDRSGNDIIEAVGGQSLLTPLTTHAGKLYSRHGGTGDWGSALAALQTMKRHVKKIEDSGGKPVGVFAPYAGTGGDYSMQTVDLLFRLKEVSKPFTSTVEKRLNKEIRSRIKNVNDVTKKADAKIEKFPGINHPDAHAFFGTYPATRKMLMEVMDNSDFRKLNTAPDVMQLRHAITDPDLRNLIRGSTDPSVGQSVIDMSGGATIRPTSSLPTPNNTYDHDIVFGGDPNAVGAKNYMGEFDVPLPMSSVFSDWTKARRKAGVPIKQDVYELRKSPGLLDASGKPGAAQFFGPEQVDNLMLERENILRSGLLGSFNRRR